MQGGRPGGSSAFGKGLPEAAVGKFVEGARGVWGKE